MGPTCRSFRKNLPSFASSQRSLSDRQVPEIPSVTLPRSKLSARFSRHYGGNPAAYTEDQDPRIHRAIRKQSAGEIHERSRTCLVSPSFSHPPSHPRNTHLCASRRSPPSTPLTTALTWLFCSISQRHMRVRKISAFHAEQLRANSAVTELYERQYLVASKLSNRTECAWQVCEVDERLGKSHTRWLRRILGPALKGRKVKGLGRGNSSLNY